MPITNVELRIAQSLFNSKEIIVNAHNKEVFRKLTILPNCERLQCQSLGLTQLPALPQCRILECYNGYITKLPALPQCIQLSCWNNLLTELPALPLIEKLNCSDNQLTELPALPQCLHLDCSYNELTELPAIHQCEYLDCCYNRITELPELPNCIKLDCSYNQITVIPPLPHCPDPIIDHNPILPPAPLYQSNRAWWASPQQKQTKQQLRKQLTQQQKKQVQKTDPISLQQFQSPALGNDFAIYDDSTLSRLPFKGMRGLDVTSNLPLKQAVKKYNTQQDPVKKRNMKKDIAKYVALLQTLRGYGLQELFGQQ